LAETDSQTQPTPSREARTRDARVKPLYVVLAVIGVIVVVLGGVLLLTGGKDSPPGAANAGSISPTAGHFTFHIDQPQVLLTSPQTNPGRAAKDAKPAAQAVEKLIHDFYVEAYLDPVQWANGPYAGAFSAFSDGAKAEAMSQLDAMTAGAQAADAIDTIDTKDASLKEKVLMDQRGNPYSVVAVVTFEASAAMKDGSSGDITSQGQYIFEKTGAGWQVTSFSVTRNDKAGTKTASATPTGVAS
jgi:hypothetical protein